jgi:FSR family fosmidomycin resistance protein-like MFS transporter
MQKLNLLLIALAHFCVDSYASMLAPVLPLVMLKLDLNYAYAGLLGTLVSLVNLSQPLMGIWGDRMARRYLVIGGVLLAAVFSPLLGIAPSYWTIVVVLCGGGLGVAAFHPQVFSLAGELSGQRRAFGLSLFVFGGTMGLGCTPLWVPHYASNFGLEFLPLVGLPGLAMAFLVYRFVPLDNPQIHDRQNADSWGALGRQAVPLIFITVVVILRSITQLTFGLFIPLLGLARGESLIMGGLALSIYNTSGVVGSLVSGYLADRMNAKPLVWVSILLAAPALYLYVTAEGWMIYLLLAIGGCMIMASNSILVAIAQELAPENSGLASSLPLGFSWGIAGLTLAPIGVLADHIGIEETLKYLALLPIFTACIALFLPGRQRLVNNT